MLSPVNEVISASGDLLLSMDEKLDQILAALQPVDPEDCGCIELPVQLRLIMERYSEVLRSAVEPTATPDEIVFYYAHLAAFEEVLRMFEVSVLHSQEPDGHVLFRWAAVTFDEQGLPYEYGVGS